MSTLTLFMRIFRLLALISIMFLAWGCMFQLDENFVEVDPEPKVVLSEAALKSVDLTTLPDTFEIYTRKPAFTATLNFEGATIKDADISVDNHYVVFDLPEFAFQLDAARYTDGYHTIRVRVLTNSGTGSIADLNDAEIITWERKWTFRIKRSTPPVLKIVKVSPSSGKLLIEFEKSALPTQRQLDVEWRPFDSFGGYVKWSYTIDDPNQSSLIDDMFVEGDLRVTLSNLSIDPAFPSGVSVKEATFDVVPKMLSYELDGHGNAEVKTSRSLFYSNVHDYRLVVDNVTYRSANSSDTIFTVKDLNIGIAYNTTLRTYAARLKNSLDTVRLQVANALRINNGEPIDHSLEVAAWAIDNPQLGFAFDRDKETIDVLDGANVVRSFVLDTLATQVDWTTGISRDGQYYFFENKAKVYKMDRNGNTSKVLDAKTLLSTAHNIGRVTVGDRYVAFYSATSNGSNRTIVLYDLQSGTIADQITGIVAFRLKLSPDGKYLAVWNDVTDAITLYSTDGGDLVLKKTFPYTMKEQDFDFTRQGTQRFIIGATDKLVFYDPVTDQTEVKMYPYGIRSSSFRVLNQDPVSGLLSYITNDKLFLIDPGTGEFLRTFANNSTLAFYTLYDKDLYRDAWKYDCKF